MNVQLNIKRAMQDVGMTLKELSKRSGFTSSNIVQFTNPTLKNIMKVADGLGIDPRDLFYPVDDAGNEIDHANDPYLHQSAPLLKGTPALPFLSPLSNSSTDEHMKSSNDETIHSSNDEKSSSDGDSASLPVGETRKADVLICPHCGTKFMVLD